MPDSTAIVQWLGVTMYLTHDAISSTLDYIASVPTSAVVFDYTEPLENHEPERRANLTLTAERAAARGEPWLSFFNPGEPSALLREKGFADVEDLGFAGLIGRFSPAMAEGLRPGPGGHVVHARR
jgi:O-methyltransferase involved in polyketide biosynthesis